MGEHRYLPENVADEGPGSYLGCAAGQMLIAPADAISAERFRDGGFIQPCARLLQP
jgi:hypothetical protein